MAITDKNTIYSWFQTDDFPTEAQFKATWDSFWHKSESIPVSQITGLNELFNQTASVSQLNQKANKDGSNINVGAYQEKLNITNLIATAKEEVKTELLNGAPEAFDTLKEISDWISDDETAEGAILQAIQNEATARTNADNQKLDKGTYTGTAQDLKNSIDGKANTSHTHNISDVTNLQTALNAKENSSNKQNTLATDTTNTKYPTVTAVNSGLATKLDKGGYTGNASDLKNSIDGKLSKPTTTSNTTSYPFVVGEDGNGNSARLPAGDLGKNFFNSDLSNTTARNHTMNAGVTVNTLGNPHTLSGLPNKNADITNFRKVRVQNASGLDSVVDSKNLLTDGMTSMSDAEKDAWRLAQRKSNETYSTGQPRIDFILPFKLAKNINGIQYFSCIGSNLLLNLSDFQVKLINTGTGVEYPVSVVNTSASTTSQFSIGYDISTLPTGTYRVYVRNGLNINIDITTFDVVDNISYFNLSNITWQKNVLTSGDFTGSMAIGGNINRQSPDITREPSSNVRKIEFLSSEILNALEANGNFIIEIDFSRYRADIHNSSYLGLVDSSVDSLNGSGQIMFGWASLSGGGNRTTLFPTSTTAGGGNNLGQESGKMIISKKGSIIQMMAILSGNIYITTNISQANSYTGLKLMYFDNGISNAISGAQQTYNIKLYK